MFHKPILITVEGETMSIAKWARLNDVFPSEAYYNYHRGMRDPYEVLYGKGGMKKEFKITADEIEWLAETRHARSGQEDEWEIACDLIGMPRVYKDNVRRALNG